MLADQDSAYVVILVREIAEATSIPVSTVWSLLATALLLSVTGGVALRRRD